MKKLVTLSLMALLSSFALQATIFGPAGEQYPGTKTKRTGLIPNNKNKQGSATGTTSTSGKDYDLIDAESNIIAPKDGKYVPGRQY